MNAALMRRYVPLLGRALGPLSSSHFCILSMDAAACHTSQAVVETCARHGIHVVYVAAHLTGTIQPCDTHVFSRVKRKLQQAQDRESLAADDGQLTLAGHIACMARVANATWLETPWRKAVEDTGFRDLQQKLSKTPKRRFHLDAPPVVNSELPTLAQLRLVFRKKANIPITSLFRLPVLESDPHAPGPFYVEASPKPPLETPLKTRLRSFKAKHQEQDSSADAFSDSAPSGWAIASSRPAPAPWLPRAPRGLTPPRKVPRATRL